MKIALLSLALCASAVGESVTVTPTQDSDIYAFFDGPSFSVFDLNVGASGEEMAHSHHALLQFDLSLIAIPSDEIGSAKLRLFVLEPSSSNGGGLRGGNVAIHRQGAVWEVPGLQWSDLQPQESVGVLTITDSELSTWIEVDVTDLARKWASAELPNHGLVLQPQSETLEPLLNVLFASMELTNYAPQLVITRAETPPELTLMVSNGQVVITWPDIADSGWVLQETTTLSGEWSESNTTATKVGDQWQVTQPVDPSGRCFFRLVKP